MSPRNQLDHSPRAPWVSAVRTALVLLPLLLFWWFPRWTVDDAYIAFRYAKNLAEHGELVWNVGEDPVEGYTGILMPLMLAAGIRAGLPPERASDAIGVVALVGVAWLFSRSMRRWHVPAGVALGATSLLVSAAILYTHALSGLETMLFTCLLFASFIRFHTIMEHRHGGTRGDHVALGVILLLATLARPEGGVFAGLSLTAVLIRLRRSTALRSVSLLYAATLVIPGLLYELWRWSYYGQALPNTFFVKQAAGLSVPTFRNLCLFVRDTLALPVVGCAGALVIARRGLRGRAAGPLVPRGALPAVGVFTIFSIVVMAQYARSHLAMNYSHRFFVPFYPIALAVVAVAAGIAVRIASVVSKSRRNLLLASLILAAGLQASLQVGRHVQREAGYTRRYQSLLESEHFPAGRFLRETVPHDEWLVVHIDAGAIPYLAELRAIDFGRLNDEVLARSLPMEERVEYFYARDPGALVFTSYSFDRLDHGEEAERIAADPRFGRYVLVRRYACANWPDYFQFVYLRRDLSHGVGAR